MAVREGAMRGAAGAGFYTRRRSVRGVVGSTTSPVHARRGQQGAATCGGAAAQWRAAVGTPASGKLPLGTVQTLTNVTNSSTPVQVPPRARVQRASVVHARRRARARSGFAGWKQFADALFKIVFLWISKQ
jgi:hypothetical protein